MSESTGRDLVWPPTKEDLQRLYLVEKLSAAKIADAYGLHYANPKTSESMILYHLKSKGIPRRNAAVLSRKVTPEMISEWVRRYRTGESLKRIAGDVVDRVTVWNYLKRESVELRGRVQAQIQAATKHARKSFDGGEEGQAYLIGLTQGDLYVSRHGRLIRIKTASTHPAMFSLLKSCFGAYGPAYVSTKKSRLSGYEWAFTFDLDDSFSFLLEHHDGIPRIAKGNLFVFYLGGLFDAEGSIFMNSAAWFELSISNTNTILLKKIRGRLSRLGIHSAVVRVGPTQLSPRGEVWQLRVWRREDVRRLLEILPLKHPEKVLKRSIALRFYKHSTGEVLAGLMAEWDSLLEAIKAERDQYVKEAEAGYLARRMKPSTGGLNYRSASTGQ